MRSTAEEVKPPQTTTSYTRSGQSRNSHSSSASTVPMSCPPEYKDAKLGVCNESRRRNLRYSTQDASGMDVNLMERLRHSFVLWRLEAMEYKLCRHNYIL